MTQDDGHQQAGGDGGYDVATELWRHPDPQSTAMWKFMQRINDRHGTSLSTYAQLHEWSTKNISAFWGEVWHYTGIKASKPFDKVVLSKLGTDVPRPTFFGGALLNFAENLLYPSANPGAADVAIIAATELMREMVTWGELRARVARCQAGLKALDLEVGARVAGYVGNHTDALVAMLAATSLGLVWTAISPDSGVSMVLDRLRQIEPAVLFADNAQYYNGKRHVVLKKVEEIVQKLPSLKAVIILAAISDSPTELSVTLEKGNIYKLDEFVNLGQPTEGPTFEQLPADHPVYILYSSGTTGAPKCIVHGAIGTLIQHKKEFVLHWSLLPGERVFYFTTCTWMMWHLLVSGLGSGATLVLYDGSPMRYMPSSTERSQSGRAESVEDRYAMLRLASELQVSHFGTSAKYLSLLEQWDLSPDSAPGGPIPLPHLKAVYSTASPLAPSTFRYFYRRFNPSVALCSITGGTDIISLFAAGCPLVPIHAGEIQAAALGMALRAFDAENGADVTASGAPGDLVCVAAFPSAPVAFWGAAGGAAKYRDAYFARWGERVWHHGDFVQFSRATAGLVMLGRSDGVLNPAGVRFGSAEVYNVLLKHFAQRVQDALCVGRRRPDDVDETVVLFVKMEQGQEFDAGLVGEIKATVKSELSARHVPGIIDECPDIPVTVNGKKVESAVKQIISGSNIKISASVANAECLDYYRNWAKSHE